MKSNKTLLFTAYHLNSCTRCMNPKWRRKTRTEPSAPPPRPLRRTPPTQRTTSYTIQYPTDCRLLYERHRTITRERSSIFPPLTFKCVFKKLIANTVGPVPITIIKILYSFLELHNIKMDLISYAATSGININ